MIPSDNSRRGFLITGGAMLVPGLALSRRKPFIEVPEDAVTGPMVGHVSDTEAILWIRPVKPGAVTVVVRPAGGGGEIRTAGDAVPGNDLCLALRVTGLKPSTRYRYTFEKNGVELASGTFRTWMPEPAPGRVMLALGSCAYNEPSPVWTRMQESGCEGILLMGDTPYIDSYDATVIRRRHREFLHIPELRPLIASMPVWGTWDDHDFGLNAHLGDSNPEGKQHTRKGFMEYRALDQFGGPGGGVYTKFRTGPLEVWLLDPRWFSNTAKSPVNPALPTCFGEAQWIWLLRTLRESTATFKLLAMGEVWKDKENKESDDMGTFPHERDALFDFIRREKISGVLTFGGDIHCSRHLCTKGRLGYDHHDFVSSPIHRSTIPSLNVPHPDLIWSKAEPQTFLRVAADSTVTPAAFTATFLNAAGDVLHESELTAKDLAPD